VLLNSIRKYSLEDHKILVVETSFDQSSQSIAEKYNALFTNCSKKYEIGAYQHSLVLYPDENEYFMFQDSLEIVQYGWEDHYRELSCGTKMVAMASYKLTDDPCPGCGSREFNEITNQSLPTEASAVLCNCFYIPQAGKNLLVSAGLMKMYANDKNDTYGTERVLGALVHISCGFDSVSSILGDWVWEVDHFVPNHGFNIYVQKYSLRRQ
jgi:hypothetical protein